MGTRGVVTVMAASLLAAGCARVVIDGDAPGSVGSAGGNGSAGSTSTTSGSGEGGGDGTGGNSGEGCPGSIDVVFEGQSHHFASGCSVNPQGVCPAPAATAGPFAYLLGDVGVCVAACESTAATSAGIGFYISEVGHVFSPGSYNEMYTDIRYRKDGATTAGPAGGEFEITITSVGQVGGILAGTLSANVVVVHPLEGSFSVCVVPNPTGQ